MTHDAKDFLQHAECMTCCRSFTYELYELFDYIACPHCGAHYLPLHAETKARAATLIRNSSRTRH